jgi:hypothetical protein
LRLYRTTAYWDDAAEWVRYGTNKIRFAAAANVSWNGKRRRVVLDAVDIPDDGWQRIADTQED